MSSISTLNYGSLWKRQKILAAWTKVPQVDHTWAAESGRNQGRLLIKQLIVAFCEARSFSCQNWEVCRYYFLVTCQVVMAFLEQPELRAGINYSSQFTALLPWVCTANTPENITQIDIFFPLSGNGKVKGMQQLDVMSYQMTRKAPRITKESQLFLPFKTKKGEIFELTEKERKLNETKSCKCHWLWSAYAQTSAASNSTLTESVRVRFPSWRTTTESTSHMHFKSQSQL